MSTELQKRTLNLFMTAEERTMLGDRVRQRLPTHFLFVSRCGLTAASRRYL
jgi:hypothetical protein